MNVLRTLIVMFALICCCADASLAQLQRQDVTFKIFQFPASKIPRVDGNSDDWSIVPDEYAVGTDQLL